MGLKEKIEEKVTELLEQEVAVASEPVAEPGTEEPQSEIEDKRKLEGEKNVETVGGDELEDKEEIIKRPDIEETEVEREEEIAGPAPEKPEEIQQT